MAIPFIDKDGVELGDQGKNRKPHDHGLDYREDGIYAAPKALRKQVPEWSDGKLVFAMDMHCPGPSGKWHEVLLFPGRLRDEANWKRAEVFLRLLEESCEGDLKFILKDSNEFTTWDGTVPPRDKPPSPSFATWARTLEGVHIGTVIEIPYANASGQEVNQDSARAFGHDIARALCRYLKHE
jgi:hypothetical protein